MIFIESLSLLQTHLVLCELYQYLEYSNSVFVHCLKFLTLPLFFCRCLFWQYPFPFDTFVINFYFIPPSLYCHIIVLISFPPMSFFCHFQYTREIRMKLKSSAKICFNRKLSAKLKKLNKNCKKCIIFF